MLSDRLLVRQIAGNSGFDKWVVVVVVMRAKMLGFEGNIAVSWSSGVFAIML
jgi:hypothetical protein